MDFSLRTSVHVNKRGEEEKLRVGNVTDLVALLISTGRLDWMDDGSMKSCSSSSSSSTSPPSVKTDMILIDDVGDGQTRKVVRSNVRDSTRFNRVLDQPSPPTKQIRSRPKIKRHVHRHRHDRKRYGFSSRSSVTIETIDHRLIKISPGIFARAEHVVRPHRGVHSGRLTLTEPMF